jgi:hypothetical protein
MNTEGQTNFNGDPQGCECINKDSTFTIAIPCTFSDQVCTANSSM